MGEELLLVVLEGLFELAVYLPWDWLLFIREKDRADGSPSECIGCMILAGLLLGFVVGGLSLLVWPDVALQSMRMRLLNLCGTPVLCGAAAVVVARRRVRRGAQTSPALHFWFAFIFVGALVTIRFVFAHRI